MPYARRIGQSTRFEPLPMSPTIEMKDQVAESVKVWDNIQENAREGKEAERYQSEPKIIKVAREEDEGGVSADVRKGTKANPRSLKLPGKKMRVEFQPMSGLEPRRRQRSPSRLRRPSEIAEMRREPSTVARTSQIMRGHLSTLQCVWVSCCVPYSTLPSPRPSPMSRPTRTMLKKLKYTMLE